MVPAENEPSIVHQDVNLLEFGGELVKEAWRGDQFHVRRFSLMMGPTIGALSVRHVHDELGDLAAMAGATFLVGLLGGFGHLLELVSATSRDDDIGAGLGEENG